MKKKLAPWLYSIICFSFFLIFVEIVLGSTHLFNARRSCSVPDPVLTWRYAPHCNYWHNKENDHPITGTFNSYGWRDKEWSREAGPGTYRVAVIGDSYVEALQVESDRTFAALTGSMLNETSGGRVEIMNFGRAGATQTEEMIILENEVLNFSPDLVVLFFVPANDIHDINRETSPGVMRPFYEVQLDGQLHLDTSFTELASYQFKSVLNPFKRRSALLSLMSEKVNTYFLREQMKARNILIDEQHNRLRKPGGYLSLCTDRKDPRYVKNYEFNKKLISTMSEYCRERNIGFMLVVIDTDAYITDIDEAYQAFEPSFDSNFFEDDMGRFASVNNIHYLGLQRIFRAYYENQGKPLHWGNDHFWEHWNYEGHEIVARALAEKLKTLIYENETLERG